MPVVHEYRSKHGMYIKARHGNSMVTYQLAPDGVAELNRLGMGEGSQISPDALHSLVSAGMAYTHGSGAGLVDYPNLVSPVDDSISITFSLKITVEETSTRRKSSYGKQAPEQSKNCLSPRSRYADDYSSIPVQRPWSPPHRKQHGRRAHYHELTSSHQSLEVRPEPVRSHPAPELHSSPLSVSEETTQSVPELPDLSEVARSLWPAMVCEFLGIPVWLWLFMAIAVLIPGLLIGSLIIQR